MIIVPVTGDRIKTVNGLPFKVLSFTNYKPEGPAVLVESSSGSGTESVFFDEISEINGKSVRMLKSAEGYKVFESDGFFPRTFQLPQVGEFIRSKSNGIEERSYEVQRIRIHVQGKLSSGMIFDCQEKDAPSVTELSLDDIDDIDHYLFKREKFLSFYSDYRPKGAA
jgi:hypothetical protein